MIAATVTSMVPQGLVLMTTLAFTLGPLRMSGAWRLIVQRLDAVETMASIDVLCMDKTGTLTTGRLQPGRGSCPSTEAPTTASDAVAAVSPGHRRDASNQTILTSASAAWASCRETASRHWSIRSLSSRRTATVPCASPAGVTSLVLGACERSGLTYRRPTSTDATLGESDRLPGCECSCSPRQPARQYFGRIAGRLRAAAAGAGAR